MSRLGGFQLVLIGGVEDFCPEDIFSSMELKALVQTFSANDCSTLSFDIRSFSYGRPCLCIFMPLWQATDPLVWNRIVRWLKSGDARSLRLRYENFGKNTAELEKVGRLLEITFKELCAFRAKFTMTDI